MGNQYRGLLIIVASSIRNSLHPWPAHQKCHPDPRSHRQSAGFRRRRQQFRRRVGGKAAPGAFCLRGLHSGTPKKEAEPENGSSERGTAHRRDTGSRGEAGVGQKKRKAPTKGRWLRSRGNRRKGGSRKRTLGRWKARPTRRKGSPKARRQSPSFHTRGENQAWGPSISGFGHREASSFRRRMGFGALWRRIPSWQSPTENGQPEASAT